MLLTVQFVTSHLQSLSEKPAISETPGVPGAAIAIFADHRDRRIKSPISGMSDIGD